MRLFHHADIRSLFTLSWVLALVIPFPAAAQSGSDLPESITVQELSTNAYRQGITRETQVLRRAMEHLEAGEISKAAEELSRAVEHLRKEARVAASEEQARNLHLAANDLFWLSTALRVREIPESEVMLSNVAIAARTLAQHHRLVAQDAFSERNWKRAGENLRAAALNTQTALAFSGQSEASRDGADADALSEAMAVATRLATGGRGRKLRDRFGSAASGLSVAISRVPEPSVWPNRRSIGRLVEIDPTAGSMVVETENGKGGPHFILATDAAIVGKRSGLPLSALVVGDVVAVWFRTDSPAVADRVITTH